MLLQARPKMSCGFTRCERFSGRFSRLFLFLAAAVTLFSCGGLPESGDSQRVDPNADRTTVNRYDYETLFRYYSMAETVWRVRDEFRDTDWDLDYCTHAATDTIGLTFEEEGTLYIVFRSTNTEPGAAESTRISTRRKDASHRTTSTFLPDIAGGSSSRVPGHPPGPRGEGRNRDRAAPLHELASAHEPA